jgi:diguanylate cyclase (GGDEF)-like protein/PAS domain S-box-containing protein
MNQAQDVAALRVQSQQATLFALLKSGIPTALAADAWKALTEATAKTLAVQRASIWLLDAKRERLTLQDLYDAKSGRHSNGLVMEAQQYPAYFQALRWSRAIVAPDAAADPHTKEFATGYLVPLDIVSLMDAGIWRGGEARGVVCLESVGERRDWFADEQQFTGSIADLAVSVLDNEALRAARTRLEESETLFSRALRSSPDWISVVRIDDGVILHVNDAFERESGYAAAEVIGRPTLEIGLWADPGQRVAWIERIRNEGLVREHEVDFLTKSGERRTFLLSGHRVEIGGEACVVTSSRDISELKRRERLVRDIARGVGAEIGESFFRSLVDHLAEALGADVAFVGELGRPEAGTVRSIATSALGKPMADFEYPLSGSPCETILAQGVCVYPKGVAVQFPHDRALTANGIEAYVGAPLIDASGKPLGLIAVLFKRPLAEVALVENLLRIFAARASAEMERRRQLRSLEYQARYDPLTGLVNRMRLREIVEEGMAANAAAGRRGALLLLDLDRFKEVNDTLGHPVGDALLIRLSRRLEREMASGWGGQVGRLGGDEFGVWIGNLERDDVAEIAAARALAAITAPLEIEGYRLEVGASVGIAIAPDHAESPSGLLRCADVAMYDAKRHGSGFSVYHASLDPYSEERLALLTELGGAMGRGEMRVHYQPRRHLATGKTSGFEALARWEHPRLGLLGPGKFVPLAELSDVIRPLTLWVLETALKQRCAWDSKGGRMAVNLSARHLLDDSCPEQIGRVISQTGADPSMLELEITESGLIADPDRAQAILERIRDMGIRIAIDDFGTGYSSLSHLKRLPVHALKIDISFVRQMLSSPADGAIVDSTIGLAHQLGLSVAAEGIENTETLEALLAHGCDEGQGFFIGRPMPAADATAWMASH